MKLPEHGLLDRLCIRCGSFIFATFALIGRNHTTFRIDKQDRRLMCNVL